MIGFLVLIPEMYNTNCVIIKYITLSFPIDTIPALHEIMHEDM